MEVRMLLTTPTETPFLRIESTAQTVIQPGENLQVKITFTAKQPVSLHELTWETPETISLNVVEVDPLPIKLKEGQSASMLILFSTNPKVENFGEMTASLVTGPDDGKAKIIDWTSWISVFQRQIANNKDGLSDTLRDRLIHVVNHRKRNGQILLADFVSFFDHFLNIAIDQEIAKNLHNEFLLTDESLPVDPETWLLIILGHRTFYGIECLELAAEDECNESDACFHMDEARETKVEEI